MSNFLCSFYINVLLGTGLKCLQCRGTNECHGEIVSCSSNQNACFWKYHIPIDNHANNLSHIIVHERGCVQTDKEVEFSKKLDIARTTSAEITYSCLSPVCHQDTDTYPNGNDTCTNLPKFRFSNILDQSTNDKIAYFI